MQSVDVVIVGAGPIGLEVAAALKAAGIAYVQFEAGDIGATMGWWAPGTRYFSSPERIEIAGVPMVTTEQDKATREEYRAYLRQVVRAHGLDVRTYQRIVWAEAAAGGYALEVAPSTHGVGGPEEAARGGTSVADSTRWTCRRLVLAIGDMHLPRLVGCPGEDLPHVSHYLADPHRYYGRKVLIVGGKNSAVEAAIRLYRVGAHVAISYRRGVFDSKRVKYWLLPELEWLIEKRRIGFFPETEPAEIRADGTVTLRSTARGDLGTVDADDVLLMTGYCQDPTLFEQLGVELLGRERKPRHDPATMETNVPGVYVAGTAIAGTQRRTTVFIETAHAHAERIATALQGGVADVPEPEYGQQAES